jgi:hypothetical protein
MKSPTKTNRTQVNRELPICQLAEAKPQSSWCIAWWAASFAAQFFVGPHSRAFNNHKIFNPGHQIKAFELAAKNLQK